MDQKNQMTPGLKAWILEVFVNNANLDIEINEIKIPYNNEIELKGLISIKIYISQYLKNGANNIKCNVKKKSEELESSVVVKLGHVKGDAECEYVDKRKTTKILDEKGEEEFQVLLNI